MKHIAQVNIGRLLGGPDDPRMADFYPNLARVNEIADRMPGFVWRLKNEAGTSSLGLIWPGDPNVIVNISVWEDAETLGKFVFQTAHRTIYTRKHEFLEAASAPTFAMWWIEPGHIPTIAEAKERLDHYTANGPSEFAFGWAELPSARFWLEKRCA